MMTQDTVVKVVKKSRFQIEKLEDRIAPSAAAAAAASTAANNASARAVAQFFPNSTFASAFTTFS